MDAKNKPASGLTLRFLSALILAPLVIAIIFYGGMPFKILLTLSFIVAMKEWHCMVRLAPHPVFFWIAGFFYMSTCYCAYWFLREGLGGNPWPAIGFAVCLWAGDSGAYVTGKTFGGPKFAPNISPKKTWAGFFGSMVFCALGLLAIMFVSTFFDDQYIPVLRPDIMTDIVKILITGMIVGAVGQYGDLLMSKFKRRAGIKDSGCLIPGHGGLLDRIDSMLLASPVFLVLTIAGIFFW